jgi:hypothetical protein
VKRLSGVQRKLLLEFIHDFTGLEPVKNTFVDDGRLAQDAGLDEVTAEDVRGLFDSRGQQLSNEDLEKLDK